MYKDNFIVAVKSEGNILRERGSVVSLPFGSEYSLLLKNMNSRKASVKVNIDGIDVLSGKSLILEGNTSMELKRFLEDLNKGNKFKFIQKTKEIIEHRGDRIDDGIVRVDFRLVKKEAEHIPIIYDYYPKYWRCKYRPPYYQWEDGDLPYWYTFSSCDDTTSNDYIVNCSMGNSDVKQENTEPKINNDEGITVKGSKSDQAFYPSWIGELEQNSIVITLKLRGETSNGRVINEPLTVKNKLVCPSCGLKSKSDATYCSRCGTHLI